MLPRLTHRLLIAIAVVIGGLSWLSALAALTAANGSGGISLMDARVGPVAAVAVLVAAGLAAIIGALVAASAGNPLAGAFTLASSLLVLAAMGGSIDGFLRRADQPGSYKLLAIESVIWLALLAVLLISIDRLRTRVRPKLGKCASNKHLGLRTYLTFPGHRSLLAGLITAGIGGFLVNILIQATDGGQVNGSLILGFMVAAMIGKMTVPQRNPIVILLSPMLVGLAAYLWVLGSYHSSDALLADFYSQDLLNLALALPIHYASAGVAGCALGVGLGQSLEHVRHTTTVTA